MNTIKTMTSRFLKNEDGASFLEYTVLLAIILVASILTIRAVGHWAAGQWTALNTTLNS
ncbi:MAG: Flp family type IVb pilin [Pseudomonadales bacterium]